MHAVDTNVIVRLLVADDPAQLARARALFLNETVWISLTVVLETEWVLRSIYKYSTEHLVAALRGVAGLETVHVEQGVAFKEALRLCEAGMDFADAVHVATAPTEAVFSTFDAALVKQAGRLGLAQVRDA